MGYCYMGNGAGGVALNFRVIAYSTEEELSSASPRNNTFGIVTDTNITEWIVSKKEPENPTEGMLWIETGESSLGEVDALKKNSIIICPIAAHQHTADGWVDRIGKTYLDGTWVAWEPEAIYLFRSGDQNTEITGGWSGIDTTAQTITLSKSIQTEDGVNVSTTTNEAVDLTDFGVLQVIVDAYSETFYVALLNSSGTQVASVTAESTGEVTMNLSSISGAYFIRLGSSSYDHGGWASTSFTVSKVKLLKADSA